MYNLIELIYIFSENGDENKAPLPPSKRPKTSSVLVEQTGDSDKVVIDQVTDSEAIFEDVSWCGNY